MLCKNLFTRRVVSIVFLSLCILFQIQANAQEKKLLRKQDFSGEIKDYKRSSLLVMSIDNAKNKFNEIIRSSFQDYEITDNFNDHSFGEDPFIQMMDSIQDKSVLIAEKLAELDIAKKLVAKWFNRDSIKGFNLDLVKERGLYNASSFDIQIADQTIRGNKLLEDAGENLIGNTFVIVHDFKYINKKELAETAGGIMDFFMGSSNKTNQAIQGTMNKVAKGYVIKTTSYLFRLVWDQETSTIFYRNHWVSEKNLDEDKVQVFNESDIFNLEYIGKQDAWSNVFSIKYQQKTLEELIARSVVKSSNKALAKLERKFEVFRVKTPLISVNPIAAKIGIKEGLQRGDRYEVLEQVVDENGKVIYNKVATIKVDKDNIWDNSYLPDEQPKTNLNYTIFKGKAKKLYPGLLIRYQKNVNLLNKLK